MKRIMTVWAALALLSGGLVASLAEAQELPRGVTEAMIEDGKQLYTGAGICFACHGQDAKGMPGVGPNLTDREWLHTDGSFQRIADLVLNGIDAKQTKSGVIMPPKGGSMLNEQQIRAVAAYVWTLSRADRAARGGPGAGTSPRNATTPSHF